MLLQIHGSWPSPRPSPSCRRSASPAWHGNPAGLVEPLPAPAVVVELAETAALHDGEAAGEGRAGGALSARARRLAGHLLYPRTPTFFVRPLRPSPRVPVRRLAVWDRVCLSAHDNVRAAVIIVMCGVSRESYGCVRARARRGRKFMATAARNRPVIDKLLAPGSHTPHLSRASSQSRSPSVATRATGYGSTHCSARCVSGVSVALGTSTTVDLDLH